MQCPNCKGHIDRFDLSPECRHCGVNIFYFQQEKLLSDDAKMCELEYASLRILIAKLKAAFIAGALQITRIVLCLLTLVSLVIPFASAKAELASGVKSISFGAVGFYSAITDGTASALFALNGIDAFSPFTHTAALLAVGMILILLASLGVLACEILSFLNIKKTAKIMNVFAFCGVAFSVFAFVAAILMKRNAVGAISASLGLGAPAAAAIFAFLAVINLLILKKNIQPDIKETDILRVETRKRVKSGEISLDSLSLPVFESEEEKEKRLEKERRSLELMEGGEHQ